MIHYGRASLTPLSRIPAYYVFPKAYLDVDHVAKVLLDSDFFFGIQRSVTSTVIFLDQIYYYSLQHLERSLQKSVESQTLENSKKCFEGLVFARIDEKSSREPLRDNGERALRSIDRPVDSQQQSQRRSRSQNHADNSEGTSICSKRLEDTVTSPFDAKSFNRVRDYTFNVAGYSWSVHSETSRKSRSIEIEPSKLDSFQESEQSLEVLEKYDHEVLNDGCKYVWIGDMHAPSLSQLQLTANKADWMVYDPATDELHSGLLPHIANLLRRRYYLVEKTRNANIVGILVGTLGAAGYRSVVENLRKAAHAVGKKTYTLLMGKPNPAKLANFPEIEVFVLVSDPQGQILDSRDYLAPIITPHEAMVAFDPTSVWDERGYCLDFRTVLASNDFRTRGNSDETQSVAPRFSLIDGRHHPEEESEVDLQAGETTASGSTAVTLLATQAKQALKLTNVSDEAAFALKPKSASEFLVHKRSWKGVETPLAGAEVKPAAVAVDGVDGRAAGYTYERKRSSSFQESREGK